LDNDEQQNHRAAVELAVELSLDRKHGKPLPIHRLCIQADGRNGGCSRR